MTDRDLAPGSNLPEPAGDAWRFLLPSLAPGRVTFIGDVDMAVRAAVAPIAGQSAAAASDTPGRETPRGRLDLVVVATVGRGRLPDSAAPELRGRSAPQGAAVVVGRSGAARRARLAVAELTGMPDLLARPLVLRPAGRASRGWSLRARRSGSAATNLRGSLVVPTRAGRAGRPRVLLRARAAGRLLRIRLARALRPGHVPAAARAHPSDPVPLRPAPGVVAPHRATVMIASGASAGAPPPWLRAALREAGVDPDGLAWAMAPPRGYRSQKVLFLLGREVREPDLIVKVTQDARFNDRLDAEVAALRRLAADELVDPATVPQVVGTSAHAGLRVAVETAWRGQPFRALSTAEVDCPFAARALAWFTDLGERSARADRRSPTEREGELAALLSRYEHVFPTEPGHVAALREHAARVAAHDVPTVFFHGDPGNWNLRARPDGTIGVLDWENAQSAGPPAWDVAIFATTYGAFVAEARGRRYTPATFETQLQPGAALRSLLDVALHEYGQRVGVEPAVTGSLLVLCWVHQALKEASRRPIGAAAGCHHHEVVRRVLARPWLVAPPA